MKFTCPGCGYKTRSIADFGTYELCGVCGWEDDAVQLANPACAGGANTNNLIDHQIRVQGNLQKINENELDINWRPFNSEEINLAYSEKDIKYWMNFELIDYEYAYWNIEKVKKLVLIKFNEDLTMLSKFENFHGITKENINNFVIDPVFVPVHWDDNLNGRSYMFALISETGNIRKGYSIAYDSLSKCYSVVDYINNDNIFTIVVSGPSLEDALSGM